MENRNITKRRKEKKKAQALLETGAPLYFMIFSCFTFSRSETNNAIQLVENIAWLWCQSYEIGRAHV